MPSLAVELADLAGGASVLIERASALSDAGDHRLACHLADLAGWAAPNDTGVHAARALVYRAAPCIRAVVDGQGDLRRRRP